MAANKRTKNQREKDLADIAEMHLQGFTFREIAKELSRTRKYTISHVQVYADYQDVKTEWRESRIASVQEEVDREVAKADLRDREAWAAWNRSCKDREQIVEEEGCGEKGPFNKKRTTREGQAGGSQYLGIMDRNAIRRAALLGLDQPAKVDSTQTVVWMDPQHDDI